MNDQRDNSTATKWTAAVLAVVATIALLLTTVAAVNQSPPTPGDGTTAITQAIDDETQQMPGTEPRHAPTRAQSTSTRELSDQPLTADDGYVPDDVPVSPFDDTAPAIANLDPDLRDALSRASIDAAADGFDVVVTSGWRSERYQLALLEAAIITYGSEQEARKWVSTPDESAHVPGKAVDVGPPEAADWLGEHGSAYGLCRRYANEPWHFELLVTPGGTCPELVSDASGG